MFSHVLIYLRNHIESKTYMTVQNECWIAIKSCQLSPPEVGHRKISYAFFCYLQSKLYFNFRFVGMDKLVKFIYFISQVKFLSFSGKWEMTNRKIHFPFHFAKEPLSDGLLLKTCIAANGRAFCLAAKSLSSLSQFGNTFNRNQPTSSSLRLGIVSPLWGEQCEHDTPDMVMAYGLMKRARKWMSIWPKPTRAAVATNNRMRWHSGRSKARSGWRWCPS